MGKSMDSLIDEKYNHKNEETNYYNSIKLNYYKPDAFNQSINSTNVYYIQDPKKYECQYCASQFFFNHKLYNYL